MPLLPFGDIKYLPDYHRTMYPVRDCNHLWSLGTLEECEIVQKHRSYSRDPNSVPFPRDWRMSQHLSK